MVHSIAKWVVTGSLLVGSGYGVADTLDTAAWQAETKQLMAQQKQQVMAEIQLNHQEQLKHSLVKGQQAVLADLAERQSNQSLSSPGDRPLQVASQGSEPRF